MLCNEEKRACCKRHRNSARRVVGNEVKVGAAGRRVALLVVDKELLYSLGSVSSHLANILKMCWLSGNEAHVRYM